MVDMIKKMIRFNKKLFSRFKFLSIKLCLFKNLDSKMKI